MNTSEFWKIFSLGTELEISGVFIYNGLKQINDLKHFEYSEDVFEIMYNLSVGFERLMKIVIVLTEHNNDCNQENFENSLKYHNLDCLRKRIEKTYNLGLHNVQKEFLVLLTTFYKKHRYDRFNLNDENDYSKDRDSFIKFLSRKLNLTANDEGLFEPFKNTKQIKKFLVKIVREISIKLYEIIETRAEKVNIYTYELRSNGKAYRIFLQKDFNFEYHTVLKKELLIALVNHTDSRFISFIKSINTIPFDVQDENEIMSFLLQDQKLEQLFDGLDEFYGELDNKKERFEILEIIGNNGCDFNN